MQTKLWGFILMVAMFLAVAKQLHSVEHVTMAITHSPALPRSPQQRGFGWAALCCVHMLLVVFSICVLRRHLWRSSSFTFHLLFNRTTIKHFTFHSCFWSRCLFHSLTIIRSVDFSEVRLLIRGKATRNETLTLEMVFVTRWGSRKGSHLLPRRGGGLIICGLGLKMLLLLYEQTVDSVS